MVIAGLFAFAALMSCAYAFMAGGLAGKWAAVLFVTASLASPLMTHRRHGWDQANVGLMIVDGLHFSGLYLVAIRSPRYWPIWSAGFQLLAVLTTVAEAIGPAARARLYHGLETFWSIPMMATMCLGIALDRRAGLT